MSSYVIVKFPELPDFIKHLKRRRIHTYGIVILQKEVANRGIASVSLKIRLTAKDDTNHEIILCDLPYFRDLKIDKKDLFKRSKEAKHKMMDYIKKTFAEHAKGYRLTKLDAEFKIADSTKEDY